MDTNAAVVDEVRVEATGGLSDRSGMNRVERGLRGARSMKRAVILSLAVVASAVALGPTSTFAADAGGGYATETVLCNSVNHTVTITTLSWGILNYTEPYPVWLRIRKYTNGAWYPTSWIRRADGTRQVTVAATAGQTSYWYFDWAFQYAPNKILYISEWAGDMAPYGAYSDQRGYHTLTSCRT